MEQTARNASFLIALFTLGLTSAHAQPAFLRKDIQVPGQYKYYAIQVQTGGIVVGDFNGDGRPDLVVASQGGIDVLLNSGGGNFGRPIHTEQSGVPVTADFNGDGKLDLMLPDGHLLLGRGDGTFLPPRYMPGGGVAAAGDFNNDGRVDLLTYGRVLLGNGDGTFRPGGEILQGAPVGHRRFQPRWPRGCGRKLRRSLDWIQRFRLLGEWRWQLSVPGIHPGWRRNSTRRRL